MAFITFVEKLSEFTGKCVAWLALVMSVLMFLVVLLRYAFDLGWIGLQQSVTYLYGVFFLLGIAYTQKHHGHVRVDIVYQKCSPRVQAIIDLMGTLLLLLPVCCFIFWVSWGFVALSWQSLESSNAAGGLPGIFILKSFLLVMPVLLALQGLAQSFSIILWLRGDIPYLAPYQRDPGDQHSTGI